MQQLATRTFKEPSIFVSLRGRGSFLPPNPDNSIAPDRAGRGGTLTFGTKSSNAWAPSLPLYRVFMGVPTAPDVRQYRNVANFARSCPLRIRRLLREATVGGPQISG